MRKIASFALMLLVLTGMSFAQTEDKEKAKLTALTQTYTSAKASFKKKPKDAKVKKSYVTATVALGTATMNAGSLRPQVKYSGALRLYREALAVDPKNKEALANKKMIEDIYQSMGRPIPK